MNFERCTLDLNFKFSFDFQPFQNGARRALLFLLFSFIISIFCFLRRLFYTYQLGQRVSKEGTNER